MLKRKLILLLLVPSIVCVCVSVSLNLNEKKGHYGCFVSVPYFKCIYMLMCRSRCRCVIIYNNNPMISSVCHLRVCVVSGSAMPLGRFTTLLLVN